MAHTWKKGEVITSELMNDLEIRADKVGEKGDKGEVGASGPAGKDGSSIKTLYFTKDANGIITGGSATLTDGKELSIEIK